MQTLCVYPYHKKTKIKEKKWKKKFDSTMRKWFYDVCEKRDNMETNKF